MPLSRTSSHVFRDHRARFLTTAQGENRYSDGTTVPYYYLLEYDKYKVLLTETRWVRTFKSTKWFDAKGRMTKLETYEGEKPGIVQENKYNEQDDLAGEFRIEYNGDKTDTIHYEYHYQYADDKQSYLAYRTNNGDTVTRYTMETAGNRIQKTEEAYPYRGFTLITRQDILKDRDGNITNVRSERISRMRESEPPDTTISTMSFVYDNESKLIEQRSEDDIFKSSVTRLKYRNGMLSEQEIDGKVIVFQQLIITNYQ